MYTAIRLPIKAAPRSPGLGSAKPPKASKRGATPPHHVLLKRLDFGRGEEPSREPAEAYEEHRNCEDLLSITAIHEQRLHCYLCKQ